MNYIPKVLELLGLEEGEHFKIKEGDMVYEEDYVFQDNELCFISSAGVRIEEGFTLMDILDGTIEIVKKPWKPKGLYHTIAVSNGDIFEVDVKWWGDTGDYMRWKLGLCFKTREEAETKGKELMEEIMKEYENA